MTGDIILSTYSMAVKMSYEIGDQVEKEFKIKYLRELAGNDQYLIYLQLPSKMNQDNIN